MKNTVLKKHYILTKHTDNWDVFISLILSLNKYILTYNLLTKVLRYSGKYLKYTNIFV